MKKKANHELIITLASVFTVVSIIAIALFFFVSSYSATMMRETKFYFNDIKISSIGISQVVVDANTTIYNPNFVSVSITTGSFSIYGNNVFLGTGSILKTTLLANGNSTVLIPIVIKNSDLASFIGQNGFGLNNVSWRIQGAVYVDLLITTQKFDFTQNLQDFSIDLSANLFT